MKKIPIILLITVFSGCASINWRSYWPYSNVRPTYIKKHLPKDFNECLNLLDTLLSPEAIAYFKQQDSTIAVIELCKEIGPFYRNHWYLDYNYNYPTINDNYFDFYYPNKIPPIVKQFSEAGLVDPNAMLRVIFTCYHKKLNHIPYQQGIEISKIKSYWKYDDSSLKYDPTDEMKMRENNIINEYYYNKFFINDTVVVLFNRAPRYTKKSDDWYFLKGIILSKTDNTKELNIKLIDIRTEFGKNYITDKTDTLHIGDLVTDFSRGWHKKGIKYFDYQSNKYYPE
jgi:hypothetical protein